MIKSIAQRTVKTYSLTNPKTARVDIARQEKKGQQDQQSTHFYTKSTASMSIAEPSLLSPGLSYCSCTPNPSMFSFNKVQQLRLQTGLMVKIYENMRKIPGNMVELLLPLADSVVQCPCSIHIFISLGSNRSSLNHSTGQHMPPSRSAMAASATFSYCFSMAQGYLFRLAHNGRTVLGPKIAEVHPVYGH